MQDLSVLCCGEQGRIGEIQGTKSMQRRLMDLGFIRGTWVECLLISPFHGMRAFRVRGGVIALRFKDVRRIWLEEKGHA